MANKFMAVLCCILLWSLLIHCPSGFAQGETQEMRQAAETGLREFVIPSIRNMLNVQPVGGFPPPDLPKQKYTYGFLKGENLDDATLGQAFQLHILSSNRVHTVKNSCDYSELNDLLHPAGTWYYPIILKNEGRCILYLTQGRNGAWTTSGFGNQALARMLYQVDRQWPKKNGYHPKLIQCDAPYDFLFTVPELGPDNLTSLSKSSNYGQVNDADTMLNIIDNAFVQYEATRQ